MLSHHAYLNIIFFIMQALISQSSIILSCAHFLLGHMQEIKSGSYMDASKPVYQDLLALVEGKDYFVLPTNVEHCFQKVGFNKHRLFYTQEDYGLFQCSASCYQETWNNEAVIRQMVEQQRNICIPTDLLPRRPH